MAVKWRDAANAELWTMNWTMDWTMDWTVDWTELSIARDSHVSMHTPY